MREFENKTQRHYKRGEYLFKEGEQGRELFIIQSGEVRVFRKDKDKIFELGKFNKGSVIGEMSLFDNSPRSATAQAYTDTQVLCVDKHHFSRQLEKVPGWLATIITMIIKRLRETNKRMKDDSVDDYKISSVAWLLYYIYDKHEISREGVEGIDIKTANHILSSIMDTHSDVLEKCYHILVKNQVILIKKQLIHIPDQEFLESFVKYKKGGMDELLGVHLNESAINLLGHICAYARKFGKDTDQGLEMELEDFEIELKKVKNKSPSQKDLQALVSAQLIRIKLDVEAIPPKHYLLIENKDKVHDFLEKVELSKAFR